MLKQDIHKGGLKHCGAGEGAKQGGRTLPAVEFLCKPELLKKIKSTNSKMEGDSSNKIRYSHLEESPYEISI